MVDATTLILAATLVQTIVITLTLLVFIFQFRSQEKAIRESSYQSLMGRYNDLVMMQASKPGGGRLFVERISRLTDRRDVSSEEAETYSHLLVAYGILEEAFILYDKKWIDKDTWEQWAAWLKVLCENPLFILIHKASRGMFDKGFEDYISKVIMNEK